VKQFFTRPWDSQPQEDTGLSSEFPPAAFVHLPSTQAELVRGATLTTDKPARSAGRHGIAYSSTGVGGRSARNSALKTSDGAGTGDFTILVCAAPVSAASRIMPFCISGGSGESYLIYNANATLSTVAGSFTYTTFVSESSVSAAGVDGQTHVFVVRRLAGVLSLWRDGINLASGSWAANIGSSGASYDYIAGFSGASYAHVDPIYLVAGWNSGLADQQIKDLSNPWQLFEPRRVYIPTAAGGAGAQTLTPSLYSNAQSFFAPTVSVGAVSLAPSLFTDGQTFYAPTVSQGVQVLTPALLTNSSSFYVPVVSVGAVALSPSLLTNTQTFYGPTVTQAGQALSPSLYSNSQSFYAPTVTVGAVDLTPELFTSTSSFFVPYVSDGTASGFVRYFDVLSGRLLILKPLGAVAAASGATWTEVEVDFGSSPVYGSEFTITDAAITAASKVQVMPCGKAATGRTADDWAWDGAAFAANPGAGSATCYAQFLPGPIVGKRKVQYSVGA
jgi:hypothetical protein